MVALIGGLAIYGFARVAWRAVGVSMLAMMLCYCQMFSSTYRFSLLDLAAATMLSMLMTTFVLLYLRAIQARCEVINI